MKQLLQKQKEIIQKLQAENAMLKLKLKAKNAVCPVCGKAKIKSNMATNGRCKECERLRAKENYRRRTKDETNTD